MQATAETTNKQQQLQQNSEETTEHKAPELNLHEGDVNTDAGDSLTVKGAGSAGDSGGRTIRVTVRGEEEEGNMAADVHYVFPGYNNNVTTSSSSPSSRGRGVTKLNTTSTSPRRKYFSSPYRLINDNLSVTSSKDAQSSRKPPRDQTNMADSNEGNHGYALLVDKQGVHYKTMPGKLMTLPPIEDLKILKRPVRFKVKVSVAKREGKFQPVPVVVDDGQETQQQQLGGTERRYRLTKLEQISSNGGGAQAPQCRKLMVPKALKHPAKMRALHIPYHKNNDTDITEASNNKPHQDAHAQDPRDEAADPMPPGGGGVTRRKSVRFAPDTLGIARERYAKTPPPQHAHHDDDHDDENYNINNNNNNNIQIQLPDIRFNDKTGDKQAQTLKPILATFPERSEDFISRESGYREGVTKRKGSVTRITFLPHATDFRRTPISSPRFSRLSRGQGQGKKVKVTVTATIPPSWQDHKDFEDYLRQKYPHLPTDLRNRPVGVERPKGDMTDTRAQQGLHQGSSHKPTQTNTTPVCPERTYPTQAELNNI